MLNTTDLIAVCSRSFSRNSVLKEELCQRYQNVVFNSGGRLQGADLVDFLRDATKAIVALESIDNALLVQLPKLKVISKFGVGLDGIDLHAMKINGVKLGWTGGVNRRTVAEFTLALMIMMLRRLPYARDSVRAGQWTPQIGRTLAERTVGIIGCGNIGIDLIRLLVPFECSVLVSEIEPDWEFIGHYGVTLVELDELLTESDIVTLHTPLTSLTKNLVSARRLDLMKEDAILISTARGGLVDEVALRRRLQDVGDFHAACDVFESEPPTDADLIQLPNFFATPHLGGSTEEGIRAMGRAAIDGLDQASLVVATDM